MMLSLRKWRLLTLATIVASSLALPGQARAWEEGSGSEGTSSNDDGSAEATDLGQISTQVFIDLQGKTITRVEEDWLIDIAVADGSSNAPEIVTVFGPGDPNQGLHAVFEMNHSTYPDFIKGGMQLQSWWGNWFLAAKRHQNGSELLSTVERIQYTCSTRISYNRVIMEVTNGDSITYGDFGGDGSLRVRMWTNRGNLNNYNPNHSINHSRVTFGANRVNRFLRTEIRFYATDGTVITDATDRYVHQLVEANQGPAPINE